MDEILNLIRDDLRDFTAYSSARKEAKTGRVWLDANEAPISMLTVEGSSPLNRYLDQQPRALLEKFADYYQVQPNQVLVTRGSDEAIDLLLRLFCRPVQDAVLICPPTYGMYEVSAKLQGAQVLYAPLKDEDFSLDAELILQQRGQPVKLIFVCSPNNPTGDLLSTEIILKLCREFSGKALIVVDEAYVEFSEQPSLSHWIKQHKNLVVLRTLSKAFGLAALRVGVLLGDEYIVNWLQKILAPYPLSALAVQAALQALSAENLLKMQKQVQATLDERERVVKELRALAIVEKVWPSAANFILVQFRAAVEENLRQRGIILRNMEKRTGRAHVLRMSIGTMEENNQVIELLHQC